MIYEYALNPDLLSDLENCRAVFDNFRQENGKLVSDTPKKWLRRASHAINKGGFTPVRKQALKLRLDKLRQESLVTGRNASSWDSTSQTWVEFIASENSKYPYAAIINDNAITNPVLVYALCDLFLESPDCWNSRTQIEVNRSASDMVDAMFPLFCISKSITLIDPHIYPNESKYSNVLVEIVKRSASYNFGKGVNKLIFHSSDHRKDMQSSLERNILPILPAGYEVRAHLWPGHLMHDRYVITDVGGMRFGQGLDESRPGKDPKVEVVLMDNTSRRNQLSKYGDTGRATESCSIVK